jgi:hypothetical protein
MKSAHFDKGLLWFNDHREHVNRLLRKAEVAYEPTGSDVLNPALWKAEHWKWFFQQLKEDLE